MKRRAGLLYRVVGALAVCSLGAGCEPASRAEPPSASSSVRSAPGVKRSFARARAAFQTEVNSIPSTEAPPPEPPGELFERVHYPGPLGDYWAYVSPPDADPDTRQPLVIWRTGGFGGGIGAIAWAEPDLANDQSGRQYRLAGAAMMYPSLRGSHDNPGSSEGFFGEVDDLLAAVEYARSLEHVDPERVYLAGHSTGGTLVLLAAALLPEGKVHGVIALGPIALISEYGEDWMPFDPGNRDEVAMRSPLVWLDSIKTPTYVFEGTAGNIEPLQGMKRRNSNPCVQFFPVRSHDHFSAIASLNELVARYIMGHVDASTPLVFGQEELQKISTPQR